MRTRHDRVVHELIGSAADLLLGAHCAGCGGNALLLCPACARAIRPDPAVVWPSPCPSGLRRPTPVTPVAAGANADVLRRVLVAWKEAGHTRLTSVLDHLLAASVAVLAGDTAVALVPVPASRRSRRARGCDLLDELARSTGHRLRRAGLDVAVVQALRPDRVTADQAGLGADERARNLDGAFALRSVRRLGGRDVIVVDDILTTGATVAESVRVLSGAGHRPAGIAVVAATPRVAHPAG